MTNRFELEMQKAVAQDVILRSCAGNAETARTITVALRLAFMRGACAYRRIEQEAIDAYAIENASDEEIRDAARALNEELEQCIYSEPAIIEGLGGLQ